MPFTPFHVGPSGTLAFIFRKRLDLPVFVFANIAVDLEPLILECLGRLPLHPVCHSLTVGTLVGVAWGYLAYLLRNQLGSLMRFFKLSYEPVFSKGMLSAILGVWLNVLIDAFLYPEIRLFYPIAGNPLYGYISMQTMMLICALCFIPAVTLYLKRRNA